MAGTIQGYFEYNGAAQNNGSAKCWKLAGFAAYADSTATVQDNPLSATAIEVNTSNGAVFAVGDVIQMQTELALIRAISVNKLYVIRGYRQSTAASHVQGTAINDETVTDPILDAAEPAAGYQQGATILTSQSYGGDGAYRWDNIPEGKYFVSVEYDAHRCFVSHDVERDDPSPEQVLTVVGDIMYRDATAVTRLAATAPGAGLINVLAIANAETSHTDKALFDATVPETQAFGDAAATGTAIVSGRRDHKHGMMALPKLDDLAAPDNNTDLDVTIAVHGLCPKAPNDTAKFLRGDATWGAAGVAYTKYTASDTWTKPACTFVMVILHGAGAGGGSGRRSVPGNVRNGGGGGGGGMKTLQIFKAADLSATVVVTIGAGGAGGAAQTVDDTDGNIGAVGGDTTFGAYLTAKGGSPGLGGAQISVAGGPGGGFGLGSTGSAGGGRVGSLSAAGGVGMHADDGGAAGGGSGNAVSGRDAGRCAFGGGGGGGGGSISSGNVVGAGGAGGAGNDHSATDSGGGGAGGAAGAAGTAGAAATLDGVGGSGGGGSGGSDAAHAGVGGAGGAPGGGGGGGGGSLNNYNSGTGGAGAAGACVIIVW